MFLFEYFLNLNKDQKLSIEEEYCPIDNQSHFDQFDKYIFSWILTQDFIKDIDKNLKQCLEFNQQIQLYKEQLKFIEDNLLIQQNKFDELTNNIKQFQINSQNIQKYKEIIKNIDDIYLNLLKQNNELLNCDDKEIQNFNNDLDFNVILMQKSDNELEILGFIDRCFVILDNIQLKFNNIDFSDIQRKKNEYIIYKIENNINDDYFQQIKENEKPESQYNQNLKQQISLKKQINKFNQEIKMKKLEMEQILKNKQNTFNKIKQIILLKNNLDTGKLQIAEYLEKNSILMKYISFLKFINDKKNLLKIKNKIKEINRKVLQIENIEQITKDYIKARVNNLIKIPEKLNKYLKNALFQKYTKIKIDQVIENYKTQQFNQDIIDKESIQDLLTTHGTNLHEILLDYLQSYGIDLQKLDQKLDLQEYQTLSLDSYLSDIKLTIQEVKKNYIKKKKEIIDKDQQIEFKAIKYFLQMEGTSIEVVLKEYITNQKKKKISSKIQKKAIDWYFRAQQTSFEEEVIKYITHNQAQPLLQEYKEELQQLEAPAIIEFMKTRDSDKEEKIKGLNLRFENSQDLKKDLSDLKKEKILNQKQNCQYYILNNWVYKINWTINSNYDIFSCFKYHELMWKKGNFIIKKNKQNIIGIVKSEYKQYFINILTIEQSKTMIETKFNLHSKNITQEIYTYNPQNIQFNLDDQFLLTILNKYEYMKDYILEIKIEEVSFYIKIHNLVVKKKNKQYKELSKSVFVGQQNKQNPHKTLNISGIDILQHQEQKFQLIEQDTKLVRTFEEELDDKFMEMIQQDIKKYSEIEAKVPKFNQKFVIDIDPRYIEIENLNKEFNNEQKIEDEEEEIDYKKDSDEEILLLEEIEPKEEIILDKEKIIKPEEKIIKPEEKIILDPKQDLSKIQTKKEINIQKEIIVEEKEILLEKQTYYDQNQDQKEKISQKKKVKEINFRPAQINTQGTIIKDQKEIDFIKDQIQADQKPIVNDYKFKQITKDKFEQLKSKEKHLAPFLGWIYGGNLYISDIKEAQAISAQLAYWSDFRKQVENNEAEKIENIPEQKQILEEEQVQILFKKQEEEQIDEKRLDQIKNREEINMFDQFEDIIVENTFIEIKKKGKFVGVCLLQKIANQELIECPNIQAVKDQYKNYWIKPRINIELQKIINQRQQYLQDISKYFNFNKIIENQNCYPDYCESIINAFGNDFLNENNLPDIEFKRIYLNFKSMVETSFQNFIDIDFSKQNQPGYNQVNVLNLVELTDKIKDTFDKFFLQHISENLIYQNQKNKIQITEINEEQFNQLNNKTVYQYEKIQFYGDNNILLLSFNANNIDIDEYDICRQIQNLDLNNKEKYFLTIKNEHKIIGYCVKYNRNCININKELLQNKRIDLLVDHDFIHLEMKNILLKLMLGSIFNYKHVNVNFELFNPLYQSCLLKFQSKYKTKKIEEYKEKLDQMRQICIDKDGDKSNMYKLINSNVHEFFQDNTQRQLNSMDQNFYGKNLKNTLEALFLDAENTFDSRLMEQKIYKFRGNEYKLESFEKLEEFEKKKAPQMIIENYGELFNNHQVQDEIIFKDKQLNTYTKININQIDNKKIQDINEKLKEEQKLVVKKIAKANHLLGSYYESEDIIVNTILGLFIFVVVAFIFFNIIDVEDEGNSGNHSGNNSRKNNITNDKKIKIYPKGVKKQQIKKSKKHKEFEEMLDYF